MTAQIGSARLHEIEVAAVQARAEAEANAQALFIEDPTVFDLVDVRGGPVQPVRNLTHDRKRMAGLLDCSQGTPRILYEAYDPVVRQRFSVAHELGHLLLHEIHRHTVAAACEADAIDPPDAEDAERELTEDGPSPGEARSAVAVFDVLAEPRDAELEANAFAGAFLMPRTAFEAAVAEFGFGAAFLAERFGVSREAVRRRWVAIQVLREEAGP